ncbi:glutathione S-transferase family protein [Maritimibacter dapengensis]|uniref:Glutathione S-transferase family protein n=1 Tax=Maritimibacter dapengensis TaxID=2836868 RepID=A0ABS6T6V5_9RHOB|nr:glutathione S-transferase family protein [Maritimibacter dapengensis]MBV7380246.1 glutathione S-transferase family protein [Maritimibacter dapengensis]
MYQVIGKLSNRAFRVVWMLEELDQPYELLVTNPHEETATAHNPSGKVPVLLVDGEPITDSAAILQFLADRHKRFTFPAGSLERARQDSLIHMINDEMDALLWTGTKHMFLLPEDQRMPDIRRPLKWEFGKSVDHLAAALGDKDYLMGDEITVPDILAAHCLNWAFGAKYPVENEKVVAYGKRMRARPAFRKLNDAAKGAG